MKRLALFALLVILLVSIAAPAALAQAATRSRLRLNSISAAAPRTSRRPTSTPT